MAQRNVVYTAIAEYPRCICGELLPTMYTKVVNDLYPVPTNEEITAICASCGAHTVIECKEYQVNFSHPETVVTDNNLEPVTDDEGNVVTTV